MTLLDSLSVPVIVAPMAGGPSTPALVNAVSDAGGFGFLASGNQSPEQLVADIEEVTEPYGVNFFMPQQEAPDLGQVMAVHRKLENYYLLRGVEQPAIGPVDLSNAYEAKRDAVLAAAIPPKAVSSSFGQFPAGDAAAFRAAGIEVWVSVTSAEEAAQADADVLVVQGYEAGGHRLTWSVQEEPNHTGTLELLAEVAQARPELPLVAAGGVRSAADVQRFLEHGARAVSCGSAFLRAAESGISAFNRMLLRTGGPTVSTRAFTGRYARGLATAFTDNNPQMPAIYPQLSAMLKPLRGDYATAYCLVGDDNSALKQAPAAEILEALRP